MKRAFLPSLAAGLLLLTACNKGTTDPVKTGGGYWSIPTTQNVDGSYNSLAWPINFTARHTQNNYAILSGMDAQSTAPDSKVDSLSFWFVALPTDSSRYRIVQLSDTTHLQPGDVGVTVHMYSIGNYASTNTSVDSTGHPDSLGVLVKNGKIEIDFSNIKVNSATDSLVLFDKFLIEK